MNIHDVKMITTSYDAFLSGILLMRLDETATQNIAFGLDASVPDSLLRSQLDILPDQALDLRF